MKAFLYSFCQKRKVRQLIYQIRNRLIDSLELFFINEKELGANEENQQIYQQIRELEEEPLENRVKIEELQQKIKENIVNYRKNILLKQIKYYLIR